MRGIVLPIVTALSVVGSAAAQGGGPSVTLHVGDDPARRCYRLAMAGTATDRALQTCDAAIAAQAEAPRRRNLIASFANRGTIHYLAGRYAEAAGDFTRAVDAGGDTAVVHTNKGLAYEQLGREEPSYDALARAAYERALRLNPDYALARARLGELGKPRRERSPLRRRVIA